MGQINTNNYPTVDSLADADLLIVENAIHGTGTTTPKQLRENAIGTAVLKTTAQTVTDAINEIWETGGGALRGSGKAVSVTNNIIDTDIDLGRAPEVGDRILVLFDNSVTSVNAINTYNGSTAVQTPWESVPVLDFHLNGVCIIEFIADLFSPDPTAICARLVRMFEGTVYTAGTGISLSNNKITNTLPQMGVNIDGGTINSVSSGNLGGYAKAAKYIVMTFNCNATAYNGAYYLQLSQSGSVVIMYEAVLVDPVTGGRYSRNIKKYTTLICEVTNSGEGSSADPILVNVIGEITNDLADKVDAVLDAISEEKTVSGNPITISDALPVPAKSLKTTINAIQDLHGYDKPWAGGSGKNKLPIIMSEIKALNTGFTWDGDNASYAGATYSFKKDADGNYTHIELSGKPTTAVVLRIGGISLAAGNYVYTSGLAAEQRDVSIDTFVQTSNYTTIARGNNSDPPGNSFSLSADTSNIQCAFRIASGYTIPSGTIIKPMIRLSGTSADYEPWENNCPISGRTETSIKSNNENLLPNTYSSVTRAGITWTVNADGSVRATGSTGNTASGFAISLNDFRGNFYFTGCPNGGTSSTYDVYAWDNVTNARPKQWDGTSQILSDFGHTLRQVKIENDTDLTLRVNANQSNVDLLFTPMLCLPTADSADFVPYKASSVTIQLGTTVYGADINWDTGVMTIEWVSKIYTGDVSEPWTLYEFSTGKYRTYIEISDIKRPAADTDVADIMCNEFVPDAYTNPTANNNYITGRASASQINIFQNVASSTSDWKTWLASNPLQVAYKLATPTTLQLTPTQLQMLKGYNRISIEDGTITLTYLANKLDALLALMQTT